MNDYGEIIKLPYKFEDINGLLKKLTKYDKIKPLTLSKFDEETNTFILVGKKPKKLIISIKVEQLEKGYTKVEVTSKTKGNIFRKQKKIVKNIVNIIFKELENCEITKGNDDFEIEIVKIKNTKKRIRAIILLLLLFYIIFRIIFIIAIEDYYYTMFLKDFWYYPKLQLMWSIITTTLLLIIFKSKNKSSDRKRITKLKGVLYNLIEGKDEKERVNNNFSNQKTSIIPEKIKPYIDKGIDYVKKTKKEKPKVFWTAAISVGVLATWGIVGAFTGTTHIEGVFVQQRGGYTGNFVPVEITFKDGLAYGSGAGSGYLDGKYEYKIKGNKIYIIIKGQEVFSELTIKNRNTLIYGDGVVDKACEPYQYGGVAMECYNNGDGIYIKQ